MVKRGDVYWFKFGAPNKRRPVLVLTRSHILQRLGTATVAAITTTIRGVRSEVVLTPDLGLPKTCAVNLHEVHSVPLSELKPFLAALPPSKMTEVDDALVFALGVGEQASDSLAH